MFFMTRVGSVGSRLLQTHTPGGRQGPETDAGTTPERCAQQEGECVSGAHRGRVSFKWGSKGLLKDREFPPTLGFEPGAFITPPHERGLGP